MDNTKIAFIFDKAGKILHWFSTEQVEIPNLDFDILKIILDNKNDIEGIAFIHKDIKFPLLENIKIMEIYETILEKKLIWSFVYSDGFYYYFRNAYGNFEKINNKSSLPSKKNIAKARRIFLEKDEFVFLLYQNTKADEVFSEIKEKVTGIFKTKKAAQNEIFKISKNYPLTFSDSLFHIKKMKVE